MKVTSQQVKELQKRVEVTYEEAERILLRVQGDIDRGEQLLNKRRESRTSRFLDESGRIYRELLTYYLKITRKDKVILDIPLIIIVGLFMILTVDSKIWIAVVSIGIILIAESTVNIYRVEKVEERIVHNTPEEQTVTKDQQVSKEPQQATEKATVEGEAVKKDGDDDYYEITIEK